MINLLLFENFIAEKKQAGVIYHYTTPRGLIAIMKEDRMTSGHQHISFSRNPDLKEWYDKYGAICRIAFNGSDLSDKYHIEPYLFDPSKDPLFGGGTVSSPEERRKFYGSEREERIIGDEISKVKKYIIQIDIYRPGIDSDDSGSIKSVIKNNPDININYVDKFRPVRGAII